MPNKKLRCLYCKDYFEAETMLKINFGRFCCMAHAIEYGKEKGLKNRKKTESKKLREDKARIKTYAQVASEAEASVRRYIRARDYGKPCISCGTTNDVQFASGHYKTAGGYPELRFNVLNIHLQCNHYCNMRLSGNINGNKTSHGYRQGLVNRFGQWIVDYLESPHELKKYSRDDLERIKRIFNKRARFYENRKNDR